MNIEEIDELDANPTLDSIIKVKEFIEDEGSEDDPVVVSDVMDSDVVGCSLSSVKACVRFLYDQDLIFEKDVKRKSIRTCGYYK